MFYIVTGKKGGGKSLNQVRELLKVLETTNKNIVTNLPLYLEEIQDEMMERGWKGHVCDRITILDDDQAREFYRYRGCGVVVPKTGDELIPLDFKESAEHPICGRGVEYFLDEMAILFPAEGFRKLPPEYLFYAFQERKLGDNTLGAAQILTHVVKKVRDLQQEFRYVRNLGKEKFGHFKRGDFFEVRTYYYPLTTGSDETPCSIEKFTLDVRRIARCYNTAGGVGMPAAAKADKDAKKVKGLPMWSIWVGLAAVMVVGWFGVGYLPGLISWYVLGKKNPNQAGPAKPGLFTSAAASVVPLPAVSARPVVVSAPGPVLEPVTVHPRVNSSITCLGYVVRDGRLNVVLSDGRTLTEGDPSLTGVTRTSFVVDGQRIYMARPAARAVTASQVVETPVASSVTAVPAADEGGGSGSWRRDPDGVSRLRNVETLATITKSSIGR